MKQREPEVHYQIQGLNGDDKLRNLILYIADKCASDKYFGTVKLNKVLFWSDFIAYARSGEPLTGIEYFAHPQGPIPRRLPAVKERMRSRQEIAEQVRTTPGGYTQKRIIASEKADLSAFTGEQIAIVDGVIESFRGKTASDVSFRSHGRAWRIARKENSEIPYEAIFLSDNLVPSEYAVTRGMDLIREHGWGA